MSACTRGLVHLCWRHLRQPTAAIKLTVQSATASSCEQNWSNYSFIHCKSHNRLGQQRAEKLVWRVKRTHFLSSSVYKNTITLCTHI